MWSKSRQLTFLDAESKAASHPHLSAISSSHREAWMAVKLLRYS